jgi:hypothetical protein
MSLIVNDADGNRYGGFACGKPPSTDNIQALGDRIHNLSREGNFEEVALSIECLATFDEFDRDYLLHIASALKSGCWEEFDLFTKTNLNCHISRNLYVLMVIKTQRILEGEETVLPSICFGMFSCN